MLMLVLLLDVVRVWGFRAYHYEVWTWSCYVVVWLCYQIVLVVIGMIVMLLGMVLLVRVR